MCYFLLYIVILFLLTVFVKLTPLFSNFFIIFIYEVEKHIILSVFIQFFIFSKNQKGLLLFIFKHDTLLLMLIISNPLN